MAETQDLTGIKPKMLGPNEHLEIVNGQFVRMPGAPNPDKGKDVVLDTGYQKDAFQAAAQAQGLGQTQPTPQQPTQPATIQAAPVNTAPIASVPVSPTPVTPATTFAETISTVAETAGNVVASDLTSTIKEGVAMVNEAQDMANMFIPDNNS